MRILLLFLDGVGIGKADADINPFFRAHLPNLKRLLDGRMFHSRCRNISASRAELVPVNATLGVPGLPQSGTGQATIFTGVNAPRLIGRHFGPHPTTALRPVIMERNIFRTLKLERKAVCFANAFPRQFFDYVESGTRRLTVTTLACQFAGVPLLTTADLLRNEAVSADLDRARWPERTSSHPARITPEEAGNHLWGIARRHDFTLFEYWLTDHAGHSRSMETAIDVLERFDRFLGGILEQFDGRNALLVMISDHGNIEDLSTKTHTRNAVPCIVVGERRREFAPRIRSITHIAPAIVRLLTGRWTTAH